MRQGFIECLAVLMKNYLSSSLPKTSTPLDSLIPAILENVCNEQYSSDSKTIPFRICLANALTSTARSLTGEAVQRFSELTIQKLCSFIQSRSLRKEGGSIDIRVSCACLQCLFAQAFALNSNILPFVPNLIEAALVSLRWHALDSGQDNPSLFGLKLLSAILASRQDVLEGGSKYFEEILELLNSLASDIEQDPGVREIASQILFSFFAK